jgi:hypothetical protein
LFSRVIAAEIFQASLALQRREQRALSATRLIVTSAFFQGRLPLASAPSAVRFAVIVCAQGRRSKSSVRTSRSESTRTGI